MTDVAPARPEPREEGSGVLRASGERVARAGLVAGPLLAAVVYLVVPDVARTAGGEVIELGHPGRATAAVGAWMAVWWMTEAIHVAATALLPLVLLPLLGVVEMEAAAAPYANPLIFLFLGGFLLALGMQRWGTERRLAWIVLRVAGTRPATVVGAFMVVTAGLSMWVSNTATVAMMLPIALSVIDAAVPGGRAALGDGARPGHDFARALLLGIAVSASIGGVGSLIGTPPNLFLASFSREELGIEIGFARWLLIGIPLVVVMLPAAWVLLTKVLFRPDVDPQRLTTLVSGEDAPQGPMTRPQRIVLVVFVMTALAWVTRPLLEDLEVAGLRPLENLTDPGIALIAGLVLFVIPVGQDRRALDWDTARGLPWGILLLFGGGLSLAHAITTTGLDDFLGSGFAGADLHPVLVIALVSGTVVFLTEMTSNTATAAALVPIVSAVAPGLGLHPLALAVPVALAASLAFMLPVATPPNAIVFGSGYVAMPDMMRAGLRLNVASIVIVTAATIGLALPVLGIPLQV